MKPQKTCTSSWMWWDTHFKLVNAGFSVILMLGRLQNFPLSRALGCYLTRSPACKENHSNPILNKWFSSRGLSEGIPHAKTGGTEASQAHGSCLPHPQRDSFSYPPGITSLQASSANTWTQGIIPKINLFQARNHLSKTRNEKRQKAERSDRSF